LKIEVESWRELIEASFWEALFILRKGAKRFSGDGVSLSRCVFFASLREIFLEGIFLRKFIEVGFRLKFFSTSKNCVCSN
jgi:hypothetical protein